ncbi:uncharacterized protein LOC126701186 [Quercus robur]|uniref:uncharacterized protein LOC126701186 n=1 Tax=Quercus robur TaxID=38942 RepID=UPI002163B4B3|nr:uncharacterized protein LOC126701186 [Quercus robur]
MKVGETLRSYASRYWELYNEIGEGNEKIMASTFRMGLPEDSELRESLSKRPPENMRQLMRRIEEYKHLKDDRLQNKGKAPLLGRSKQDVFPTRPKKDFKMWSNKMEGDPSRRNQNLYCTYHGDKGYTTEQCHVLKDHLEQLVKAGYLKEFVVDSGNRDADHGVQQKGNPLPPPLGVIKVIHAASRSAATTRRGVLTVTPKETCAEGRSLRKRMKVGWLAISFDNKDLEGTIQPHDDALVVTAQISGFLVKRVMIDQGSGADVMYPNLFEGLGLKNQDLMKYDTPLVSFDERVVIPESQISLSVNMEGKEVMVTFIVVRSFSPYTAILGRP